MGTRQVALAAVLLIGLGAPCGTLASLTAVRADTVQSIWHLEPRRFDPSSGGERVAASFVPPFDYVLVTVVLSGSNPRDDALVQLGDFPLNSTRVQVGERRFFVASHLQRSTMPVLQVSADPDHAYGGRILTYSVTVLPALSLPAASLGIAASSQPNYLVYQVKRAALYTLHYRLGPGTAEIELLSASDTVDRRVTGQGAYTIHLRAGLVVLKLQQEPAGHAMPWLIDLYNDQSVR